MIALHGRRIGSIQMLANLCPSSVRATKSPASSKADFTDAALPRGACRLQRDLGRDASALPFGRGAIRTEAVHKKRAARPITCRLDRRQRESSATRVSLDLILPCSVKNQLLGVFVQAHRQSLRPRLLAIERGTFHVHQVGESLPPSNLSVGTTVHKALINPDSKGLLCRPIRHTGRHRRVVLPAELWEPDLWQLSP